MSKRDRPTIDMQETVENLRESKGMGIDAFFSPTQPQTLTEQQKHANNDKGTESVRSDNLNTKLSPTKKEAAGVAKASKTTEKQMEVKETSEHVVPLKERKNTTPKNKSRVEEFRTTLPLPADTVFFLDQLERQIFTSRHVKYRSQQRLTKNSIVRAWLKLLEEIKANFNNVENEDDLYKRFREAVLTDKSKV
jgi:hypothetical protein